MNRRFFVDHLPEPGAQLVLPEAESHHLRTVLRAREGDRLWLLDGAGATAHATLLPAATQRRREAAVCRIDERCVHPHPARRLVLCVAPPRAKAMDLLVRQATELGVAELGRGGAARGPPRPDADAIPGWLATAREACKQSGNPWLPQLHPPAPLAAVLAAAPPCHYLGCLPEELPAAPAAPLTPAADLALWIGPEGGFTPAELAALAAAGARPLCLGPYVLRVETAVAAGLAVLLHSCPT
jgi:16S rRNA (uracil1498-N3)-methyltransferase